MSIPVEIDDLARSLLDYRWAYVLTVGDDERAHIVATTPGWDGDALTMTAGRRTSANAATRSSISLCYPPAEPGGYSLIVDGEATVDDQHIRFTPSGAVLHRPASEGSPGSSTGCTSDCAPITPARN